MKSCRGPRCGNCQDFLAAIRATRRYINKRCTQNRKQHLLSRFPFDPLYSYLATAFSSFRPLVYSAHLCVYVQTCMCVHLRQPEYHHSSRFSQFSLRLLLFSGKENVRESWTLHVCKHRLSTSLLLWYLSVVCSSLFHLSRSSPPIAPSPRFSSYILPLDTRR